MIDCMCVVCLADADGQDFFVGYDPVEGSVVTCGAAEASAARTIADELAKPGLLASALASIAAQGPRS